MFVAVCPCGTGLPAPTALPAGPVALATRQSCEERGSSSEEENGVEEIPGRVKALFSSCPTEVIIWNVTWTETRRAAVDPQLETFMDFY